MKKLISIFIICLTLVTGLSSCVKKTYPAFNIKKESVTSIDFKCNPAIKPGSSFATVEKVVTSKDDMENLITWVHSLSLKKHEAIEFPIETIRYMMVLNGKKDHRIFFLDDYVVFDSTAYEYLDKSQAKEVVEKYNLLNYPEQSTTLGFTN